MTAERTCLALAIYHAARGESRSGQLAVARVIRNRTLSRAYPASVCGVVYENARPALASPRAALRLHKATHTVAVSPSWPKKLVPLGRIGDDPFSASDGCGARRAERHSRIAGRARRRHRPHEWEMPSADAI